MGPIAHISVFPPNGGVGEGGGAELTWEIDDFENLMSYCDPYPWVIILSDKSHGWASDFSFIFELDNFDNFMSNSLPLCFNFVSKYHGSSSATI